MKIHKKTPKEVKQLIYEELLACYNMYLPLANKSRKVIIREAKKVAAILERYKRKP